MGVSIAYLSSIASLGIAATRRASSKDNKDVSTTYFDSVVFLTMFLLIGNSRSPWFTTDRIAIPKQVDT
jgi:hypothetical protein